MQFYRQRFFLLWISVTSRFWHNCFLDVFACEHSDGHYHGDSHRSTGSLRKSVDVNTNATRRVASVRRHLQDPSTGIEECGFVGLDDAAKAEDLQEFKEWETSKTNFFEGDYYIPVYFHVIEPSANFVSDSRIQYYMSYLQNAHTASNTPFIFDLVGTTRTQNALWSQNCRTYEMDYKTILKKGGMETLNIYICQAIPVDGGAWAGFAYYPTASARDGVVIAETSTQNEIRPNTLVHEVGHFLGLPHTFNDQNTCDPDGDGIDDTPQMISQASKTNCFTTDPKLLDTCPSHPGLDPIDNYMTYSNDNRCRTRFTVGQVAKMKFTFETYRYSESTTPGDKCSSTGKCMANKVCESGSCLGLAGSTCSSSSQCSSTTTCKNLVCLGIMGATCSTNTQCISNACTGGKCLGTIGDKCSSTSQCSTTTTCQNGYCLGLAGSTCTSSSQCSSTTTCKDGLCQGIMGAACSTNTQCLSNTCNGGKCLGATGDRCSSSSQCMSKTICESKVCKGIVGAACSSNSQCSSGNTCKIGVCLGITGSTCSTNDQCLSNTCSSGKCLGLTGDKCSSTSQCVSNNSCKNGLCLGLMGTSCSINSICLSNKCVEGLCLGVGGNKCTSNNQCSSNNCVNGSCLGLTGDSCASNSNCSSNKCKNKVCK